MTIAVGLLLQELLPRFSLAPTKAVRYSLFLLIEPLAVISAWSVLCEKWQQKLLKDRVPGWYLLATGVACAGVAGLGIFIVLLSPTSSMTKAVFVYVMMYGGPLLGMWWVLRYRPLAVDPDYDDNMVGDDYSARPHIELPDFAASEAFGPGLGRRLFRNT